MFLLVAYTFAYLTNLLQDKCYILNPHICHVYILKYVIVHAINVFLFLVLIAFPILLLHILYFDSNLSTNHDDILY